MITQKSALSSAEEVLRQIEKAAEREFLPIIGPNRGKILAEEVRKANPRHILEVGTLIGYSAILMGKELGVDAEIVTIEIHRDEAKAAGANVAKANIPPKVTIITGDALEVIPTFGGKFDFAFIDAEKNEYLGYIKLAEDKFRKGTVVVADNAGIFAEQMSDYLDYVRNSGRYRSRYVQVGNDGVEISVRV
ncbi:MAG: class I SAM-dependent methyltransferase [Candidatus Bathyarchaeia archaeon]|jgi:predicted O-methyltransferase YrrM